MPAFAQKPKETQKDKSINRSGSKAIASKPAVGSTWLPRIQRSCACCGGSPNCVNKRDDREKSIAIQKKSLEISNPLDADEKEADEVARKVAEGQPAEINGTNATVNKKSMDSPETTLGFQSKLENSKGGGQSLDPLVRDEMESKMGADFGKVKVHTESRAHALNKSINAKAFTHGSDIYFKQGEFNPTSRQGKELLAHELTHTIQQNVGRLSTLPNVQRYTEDERKAMAEGTVKGRPKDIAMAQQRNFQPGEIVFRMGNAALALLIGEDVTHGGIYIGDGLIHDVAGIGNRNVRVDDFFNPELGEAASRETYKRIRFKGPHRDLIIARLLENIKNRHFLPPTDPVPFNLFSSAGDYKTATCLEYSHAQFLYAIKELSVDQNVSPDVRQSLIKTYFKAGAGMPAPLIEPREQKLTGAGSALPKLPGARWQEAGLISAASRAAKDVDPKKFQNRSESTYKPGLLTDEVALSTFTYSSFVNSQQFFEEAIVKTEEYIPPFPALDKTKVVPTRNPASEISPSGIKKGSN